MCIIGMINSIMLIIWDDSLAWAKGQVFACAVAALPVVTDVVDVGVIVVVVDTSGRGSWSYV